jgi:hypothetical protein
VRRGREKAGGDDLEELASKRKVLFINDKGMFILRGLVQMRLKREVTSSWSVEREEQARSLRCREQVQCYFSPGTGGQGVSMDAECNCSGGRFSL